MVVGKHEDFVFHDGSAERAAKLIPISAGYADLALRKGIARKIGVGALEIEERPVKFVGARLGLGSHDGPDGLAEFGVVVLRSNLHFVNGIEVRIDDDDAEDGILVIGAVQFEAGSCEMLTIRQDLP